MSAVAETRAADQGFRSRHGIAIAHARRDRVIGEMKIGPQHLTGEGTVHSGALLGFAEELARHGASLNVAGACRVRTLEAKANYFQPCRSEVLGGETTPLHLAEATMVWQTSLYEPGGTAVAAISHTQLVLASDMAEAELAAMPAPSRTKGTAEPVKPNGSAQREGRREQIIAAACDVIASNGFANSTIREIADAAGMHVPTLYQYVDSKDEVLELVYRRAMEQLSTDVDQATQGCETAREKLLTTVAVMIGRGDRYRRQVGVLNRELKSLSPKSRLRVLDQYNTFLRRIADLITEGIERQEFRDVEPEIAANFVEAMCDIWALRQFSIGRFGFDTFQRETAALIAAALGSNTAPTKPIQCRRSTDVDGADGTTGGPRMSHPDRSIAPLAITGVTVLPLQDATLLANQTVVIDHGCIQAIGHAAQLAPPPCAEIIDGAGCFLIPGLCDMHVHIVATSMTDPNPTLDDAQTLARSREYLRLFLAHGVTTVRNMAGTKLHLRLRAEVAEGRTLGPRIFTAGPILETRFTWPGLQAIGALVASPAQAREIVQAHQREGYDFIKVYNDVDADIYAALVRTSRAVGLQVTGHVPFAVGLLGAFQARQNSIEHLRSYDFAADTRSPPSGARFEGWLHTSPERLARLAERTAEAGVWNVPTLVVERNIVPNGEPLPQRDFSRLPAWLAEILAADDMANVFTDPQRRAIMRGAPTRLAMVAALDRAGAGLMPGSDCPVCGAVPGESLLRELELFVEAGISPLRTLQAATIRAAEFLGVQGQQGVVASGMRADLLLLATNPLENISSIRSPVAVIAAGRRVPAAVLRSTSSGSKGWVS